MSDNGHKTRRCARSALDALHGQLNGVEDDPRRKVEADRINFALGRFRGVSLARASRSHLPSQRSAH